MADRGLHWRAAAFPTSAAAIPSTWSLASSPTRKAANGLAGNRPSSGVRTASRWRSSIPTREWACGISRCSSRPVASRRWRPASCSTGRFSSSAPRPGFPPRDWICGRGNCRWPRRRSASVLRSPPPPCSPRWPSSWKEFYPIPRLRPARSGCSWRISPGRIGNRRNSHSTRLWQPIRPLSPPAESSSAARMPWTRRLRSGGVIRASSWEMRRGNSRLRMCRSSFANSRRRFRRSIPRFRCRPRWWMGISPSPSPPTSRGQRPRNWSSSLPIPCSPRRWR